MGLVIVTGFGIIGVLLAGKRSETCVSDAERIAADIEIIENKD